MYVFRERNGLRVAPLFSFYWAGWSPNHLTRKRDAPMEDFFQWRPVALTLCNFGEGGWSIHIGLGLVQAFVSLPFPRREPRGDMSDSWGFSTSGYGLHLNWAHRYKILRWPWDWEHLCTEHRLADGTWWREPKTTGIDDRRRLREEREAMDRERHELPYRYTLRCGEVQERMATVTVSRRTWYRRWIPFLRRSETTIDIAFSDEVGERSGSWKGGVLGCGYRMKPGETAPECLARMERERIFD